MKAGEVDEVEELLDAVFAPERGVERVQVVSLPPISRAGRDAPPLNLLDDESKRCSTLGQLNRGEGRHTFGRAIFHGKRAELRQRYREGQEDQLGALGLVVNMIVLRNTIYIEAAVDQLRKEGSDVRNEDVGRLSPFIHDHISMLGRHSFAMPDIVARGGIRPLRNDPTDRDAYQHFRSNVPKTPFTHNQSVDLSRNVERL